MLLGAQTHFAQGWDPSILDRAKAHRLPISFVRDELFWQNVEQAKGKVRPEFYDQQMTAITSRGYKLLFTAFNVNPNYDNGRFPVSDEAQAAFAAYVAACVRRFGASMVGVEVWNEPQNFSYGTPVDDAFAEAYVRLLRRTYQAVKAERPGLPVATAGTPGICSAWQKRIIGLGALQWCDKIGAHSYGAAAGAHAELLKLRAMVDGKGIWLTEYGQGRESIPRVTYCKILAYADDAQVELASAYLLRDYPEHGFPTMGLLSADGTLERQGRALKEMASKLPLSRQPSSSLAPVWRTRNGQYLTWTDLGHKVTVNGSLQEIRAPALLAAPPAESGRVVTDSTYDFRGAGWSYYGLRSGGSPVPVTETGYPFDLQLGAPTWLRLGRDVSHPEDGVAAVRGYRVPATGPSTLLGEFTRFESNGDGTAVSVGYAGGATLWRATLAPGQAARMRLDMPLNAGTTLETRVDGAGSIGWDATATRVALVQA